MSQQPPASKRPPAKQASIVKYKAALRKQTRKNAKEAEIDFLNITAMLDMMTIILVFILKSASSSNAAPPQGDDLKLPKSVITSQPNEEGIAVFVSKTQIMVGSDSAPIVVLPSREALAQSGVDARYKCTGQTNDLCIAPLRQVLQNEHNIDKQIRLAKGLDEKSEAIIIADAQTPYRLILEVLYTLGQSEFGKFHMMVLQGSAKEQ